MEVGAAETGERNGEGEHRASGPDKADGGRAGHFKKSLEHFLPREVGRRYEVIVGFGLKMSDLTTGDCRGSWLKYLNYNIDSLNERDELIRLNVISKSQSKYIQAIFEKLKEKTFDFGLNHGDISLKNVIVREAGEVNLIDWGSAEASIVPHHDLIQMLKMNMLENAPNQEEIRAFLDGCGISEVEFEQMMPELESLLLLRSFDKLRWAIDWKVENLGEFVDHAKSVVKRCLPQN